MKPWKADRALYRPDQVAELLSYDSVDTVYTLILVGELISHNRAPGKKGVRITGSSIEAYIERHLIPAGAVEVTQEQVQKKQKGRVNGKAA